MGLKIILFCLCVVLLCQSHVRGDASKGRSDVMGSPSRSREKRGSPVLYAISKAARLGQLAVDFLIDGANEIRSGSKYFRYFKKKGDYNKAFSDFKSVDPTGVTSFNWQGVEGLIGTVGDRSIILKTKGSAGKPTMEIIKRDKLKRMIIPNGKPSHVTDIITYMD